MGSYISELRKRIAYVAKKRLEDHSVEYIPRSGLFSSSLSVHDFIDSRETLIDGERTRKGNLDEKDIISLVEDNDRLVLLGDAGIGKTYILQQIAYNYSIGWQSDGEADKGIFPIYIPLKNCHRNMKFKSLVQFEINENSPHENNPIKFDLDRINEKSKLIFLLDGYNEIPVNAKEYFRGMLIELISDYPGSKFIISTRNSSVPDAGKRWLVCEMKPFNEYDVKAFVKNYFYDLSWEYKYYQILRNGLLRLAVIPLFLKFICALYEKEGNAPRTKGGIINSVIKQVYLEKYTRREKYQTAVANGSSEISIDECMSVMSQIAFTAYESEGGISFSTDFVERVSKANEKFERISVIIGFFVNAGILRRHEIVENDGNSFQRYSFFHPIIFEYFASYHLNNLLNVEQEKSEFGAIVPYLEYLKWDVPIQFFLGFAETWKVDAIIKVASDLEMYLVLSWYPILTRRYEDKYRKFIVDSSLDYLLNNVDVDVWCCKKYVDNLFDCDKVSYLLLSLKCYSHIFKGARDLLTNENDIRQIDLALKMIEKGKDESFIPRPLEIDSKQLIRYLKYKNENIKEVKRWEKLLKALTGNYKRIREYLDSRPIEDSVVDFMESKGPGFPVSRFMDSKNLTLYKTQGEDNQRLIELIRSEKIDVQDKIIPVNLLAERKAYSELANLIKDNFSQFELELILRVIEVLGTNLSQNLNRVEITSCLLAIYKRTNNNDVQHRILKALTGCDVEGVNLLMEKVAHCVGEIKNKKIAISHFSSLDSELGTRLLLQKIIMGDCPITFIERFFFSKANYFVEDINLLMERLILNTNVELDLRKLSLMYLGKNDYTRAVKVSRELGEHEALGNKHWNLLVFSFRYHKNEIKRLLELSLVYDFSFDAVQGIIGSPNDRMDKEDLDLLYSAVQDTKYNVKLRQAIIDSFKCYYPGEYIRSLIKVACNRKDVIEIRRDAIKQLRGISGCYREGTFGTYVFEHEGEVITKISEFLPDYYQNKESDDYFKYQSALILGKIRDPAAIPELSNIAHNEYDQLIISPENRCEAIILLSQFGVANGSIHLSNMLREYTELSKESFEIAIDLLYDNDSLLCIKTLISTIRIEDDGFRIVNANRAIRSLFKLMKYDYSNEIAEYIDISLSRFVEEEVRPILYTIKSRLGETIGEDRDQHLLISRRDELLSLIGILNILSVVPEERWPSDLKEIVVEIVGFSSEQNQLLWSTVKTFQYNSDGFRDTESISFGYRRYLYFPTLKGKTIELGQKPDTEIEQAKEPYGRMWDNDTGPDGEAVEDEKEFKKIGENKSDCEIYIIERGEFNNKETRAVCFYDSEKHHPVKLQDKPYRALIYTLINSNTKQDLFDIIEYCYGKDIKIERYKKLKQKSDKREYSPDKFHSEDMNRFYSLMSNFRKPLKELLKITHKKGEFVPRTPNYCIIKISQ